MYEEAGLWIYAAGAFPRNNGAEAPVSERRIRDSAKTVLCQPLMLWDREFSSDPRFIASSIAYAELSRDVFDVPIAQ